MDEEDEDDDEELSDEDSQDDEVRRNTLFNQVTTTGVGKRKVGGDCTEEVRQLSALAFGPGCAV